MSDDLREKVAIWLREYRTYTPPIPSWREMTDVARRVWLEDADSILTLFERSAVERERKAYIQAIADVVAEYRGRMEVKVAEEAAARRYPLPKEGK